MNARLPLFGKILFVAFLNLCLIGVILTLLARFQFRFDPGSLLLSPAQSRIIAMAHTAALELDETPPGNWDAILDKYGRAHGVHLVLIDENGERVNGTALQIPTEINDRIPRRPGRRPPRNEDKASREAPKEKRTGTPALFLASTNNPTAYWAGVRVPVRRDRDENPKPGTLVVMSPSLLGSDLFFDPKPWLMVVLAVVMVSVCCWMPFIRGLTRSLSEMTRAAGQIAEGHFDVQVSDRRRDEIGQLGGAINRMASRLSGYVHGQKRFLGGIAHELANPIATVQFGLGGLERRVGAEHAPAVADIAEEMEHMSGLVNELLSFSRAGMHGVQLKLGPVDIASVVARAVEREKGDADVRVSVDDRIRALGDGESLFRAVSNLIRNAVRYAGMAGPIDVASQSSGGRVRLTVSDHGPGVPQAALDEIFTPFYRLDDSRDAKTGGVGLGLAIVKACVESCEGTVRCRNRAPSGLEVEIELPEANSSAIVSEG